MAQSNTDRNMLFGILALQLDFIDRDQLVAGMHDWLLEKSKPLGAILVDQGVLGEQRLSLVEALVDEHLKQHRDDPAQSLAALSTIGSSVEEDLKSLQDADVAASLDQLAALVGRIPIPQDPSVRIGESTSTSGRFRILRPHAKGGLGEVSVALDQELNREVALKRIQARFVDQPDSRARFVQEAEITGGMEHPGIVPVYGLGHYDDGRPFYAMRFVRGDSLKAAIKQFHNAEKQPGRDKSERLIEFRKLLGRFVDVCNAVEYAHSRGVLHRDLKPGNIMLGKYGETLVVDWGLAKTVGRKETKSQSDEATLYGTPDSGSAPTQLGSALGTPHYMSPEQAAGDLDGLGPASDVYSLGATLYCLLTGKPPIEGIEIDELLSKVKRGEFARPSELKPETPKSLEAICLRAMALRPQDRYSSPQALAEEIERYLADEPVAVYAEPLADRSRRWLRQHPRSVAALAATVLVGLASLAIIAAVVTGTNQQLSVANADLKRANKQILEAEQEARDEADIATALNTFVQEDLLGQASPFEDPDRDIKLRTVLDRASESVADRFTDQPLVEAAVQRTIGATYLVLGAFEQAQSHLERALTLYESHLGPKDPKALQCMQLLADAHLDNGQYAEAEQLGTKALSGLRQVLGERHTDTIDGMHTLGRIYTTLGRFEQALPLQEEALETCNQLFGREHEITLKNMQGLAGLYCELARYKEAQVLREEALELAPRVLGEEHPGTLYIQGSLAETFRLQGRLDAAETLAHPILESGKRVFGEEHPVTLTALNNLAVLYHDQGRHAESEELHKQSLALMRRVLGDDHHRTVMSMNNLAIVYMDQGRIDEAEGLIKDALETQERVLGPEHPATLGSKHNLAWLLRLRGDYDSAGELAQQTLEVFRRVLGDEHPNTLSCMGGLSLVYRQQEQYAKAESLRRTALATQRRVLGTSHPGTIGSMEDLAELCWYVNKPDEAATLLVEAIEASGQVFGEAAPRTIGLMGKLAGLRELTRGHAHAEPLLRESLQLSRTHAPDTPQLANALFSLSKNLNLQGKYAAAETLLRESVQLSRAHAPDTPQLANALASLGNNLNLQGRYAEAEPLFREQLELCRSHDSVGALLATALEMLGENLHQQGRYEEAEPLVQEHLKLTRANVPDSPRHASALAMLGVSYLEQGKFEEAEVVCRECLAIREQHLPDHWQLFNAKSLLGASLLGQGALDDAEPLLVQGFQGLKERAAEIPEVVKTQRLTEAIERLVSFYEAAKKPEEIAIWQAELRKWIPTEEKKSSDGDKGQPKIHSPFELTG